MTGSLDNELLDNKTQEAYLYINKYKCESTSICG